MDYYLITIFSTVLSGVSIFIIGQIIQKFIIEPIHKQKEIIGDIANALIYYANLYSNSTLENESKDSEISKKREEASEKFRKLGCQLISKTHLIPYYETLSILKIVVKKQNIVEARGNLIGLSNSMYPRINSDDLEHNYKRVKELNNLLNLITNEED
jgi:hypothetical protein